VRNHPSRHRGIPNAYLHYTTSAPYYAKALRFPPRHLSRQTTEHHRVAAIQQSIAVGDDESAGVVRAPRGHDGRPAGAKA
jgi:hypothetical protein